VAFLFLAGSKIPASPNWAGGKFTPTNPPVALWTYDNSPNDDFFAMTRLPNGNTVFGGDRDNNVYYRSIFIVDADGVELLKISINGGTVYGLCTDSNGNFYAANEIYGDWRNITKFNISGVEQWNRLCGTEASYATAYHCCCDDEDNVYVCGGTADGANLRKYDSDGNLMWSTLVGSTLRHVRWIPGRLYVCGTRSNNVTLSALDLSTNPTTPPTVAWTDGSYSGDRAGTQYRVDIDANGNVATCGVGYTSNFTGNWRVYDSTGTRIAYGTSSSTSHSARSCAFDENGDLFLGHSDNASYNRTLAHIDVATRTVNWYWDSTDAIYELIYEVPAAVDLNAHPPGMRLPLNVGAPRARVAVRPSGLIVPLRLGLPDATPAPQPPDVATQPGRPVYRLYLVDGGAITELPFAAIQCRRRLGASTWAVFEVPTWSDALQSACEAAAAAGGELVVYAGLVSDGVETRGEFLRAVLTSVEASRRPHRGGLSLTGRVQNPSYTAQSRTLFGVRSRANEDGRRSARCEVDPLLRPNDTVDDGEESWTVGSIVYRIAPREAWMDVAEVANG
jgi:hypothetical protein